jgi:hypothetical protein
MTRIIAMSRFAVLIVDSFGRSGVAVKVDWPTKFQACELAFVQAVLFNDLATSRWSSADCIMQPLPIFSQNGHANPAFDACCFQTVGQSGSALNNAHIRCTHDETPIGF